MNSTEESSSEQRTQGLVEEFSKKVARGWIVGAPDAFPVRIDLCVNDDVVSSTWADSVSQINTLAESKSFTLGLRDLWAFVRRNDRISICINGTLLPISGHGLFYWVTADGDYSIEELHARFASGYVFDRTGRLRLSKSLDTNWQKSMIDLYERVRDAVKEASGYDTFVFYGTLLGQVRDKDFIGHDDDFDAAYLSVHTDGPSAAREICNIGFKLIGRGFNVHGKASTLHIYDPADPNVKIDLFHTYFDSNDHLALPFGRAGDGEFKKTDWHGVTNGDLGEHSVLVPVNAEPIVAHLYGENWKIPQAGFSWKQARTARASDGIIAETDRESLYWANFYAHTQFNSGSSFFELVNAHRGLPNTVLDIGSGDGRDTFAFATAGRHATGIDRSHIGIEHATKKAGRAGLGGILRFDTCDVSDIDSFQRVIAQARERSNGKPLLFYMRFFLHSIPIEAQDGLMKTISEAARRGDYFATEFRTDKDEKRNKTFGSHYRRYQNGPAFGRALNDKYGFIILKQEQGTGLSVYKNEDPHLYRVIGRKGLTLAVVFSQATSFARKIVRQTKTQFRGNGAME